MLPTTDAAITSGITEAVQELLPALEQFLQYEDEDLSARDYPGWRDALDEPLPFAIESHINQQTWVNWIRATSPYARK